MTGPFPVIQRATDQARAVVAAAMQPGDVVIDATVGNGHDTRFLAEHVGPAGRVYGFDVQASAIEATRLRVAGSGWGDRVVLFPASHADAPRWIPEAVEGCVGAVMFNLGYLPGGDHAVATKAATTVQAVDRLVRWLRVEGVLTVVYYQGHPGALEERDALLAWLADRITGDARFAGDHRPGPVDRDRPPGLVVVERIEPPI